MGAKGRERENAVKQEISIEFTSLLHNDGLRLRFSRFDFFFHFGWKKHNPINKLNKGRETAKQQAN